MGSEAICTVRVGRKASEGKARLEAKELFFRGGDVRLVIPFERMTKVSAKDGVLEVTSDSGVVRFELGTAAAKWADKIRNPKSLIDKLGVKPTHRVSVIGVSDRGFLTDLRARAADVSTGRLKQTSDLVFYGLETRAGLSKLAGLRDTIAQNGAIWTVWPKGRPELKEDHIRAEAIRVGLTDVKVAAFSETHSALKLVIPVVRRKS